MPGIILAAIAMIVSAITPHYYLFLVSNIIAGVAIGKNSTVHGLWIVSLLFMLNDIYLRQ